MSRRVAIALTIVGTVACSLVAWRSLAPQRWSIQPLTTIATSSDCEARRLRFSRGSTVFDAAVFRFPIAATALSIADVNAGQSLADLASTRDVRLAINAGYFDAALEPIGLLRIDGVDRGTLLRQPPLSGLVLIEPSGALALASRDDHALATATSAFQSGPFLIDPGGTIGIARADGPATERTVIATTARDVVVLVTSPVTLSELAECLHDCRELAGTPIDRALNLDGGPSSGFAFHLAGNETHSPPRGRIRNALLFSHR